MAIKRNDPCLCGSGKKYKKCCLNKESMAQIQEVKEERFLQSKHTLVLKLRDFINKKVPASQYYQLQSEFKKRSQQAIKGKFETGFFEFWLFFFHRYENDMRGIEWFVDESSTRLSQEDREMALNWKSLVPQIVQAVDRNADIISFEDVFTKEHYPVAFVKGTDPAFAPWIGTIALLEPFEDLYYFNGVRTFEDPNGVIRAKQKVEELTAETGKSREEVLVEYFPEILAALVIDEHMQENQSRDVTEYLIEYKIADHQALLSVIDNNPRFVIDTWEENKKLCSWIDNWNRYTDNQLASSIHLAEVYGKISITNDVLQFNSLDNARVEEFKQMVQGLVDSSAITLSNEFTNSLSIPFHAEIRDMVLSLDSETPQYFALYAQNDVRFAFDKPIRQFDGLSIKELMETGRVEDAENWLKQMEYNMYYQVHQQFKEVTATADYNTVRKELGLPLSPFVTGGEARYSAFEQLITDAGSEPAQQEDQNGEESTPEDFSSFEELGFTPTSADLFFADDFVAFYNEKTEGKKGNTVRKYRSSLNDLRLILEQNQITGWEQCDEAFWFDVFTQGFPKQYEILTKTAIKDFISTTKALAKWLDQKKTTTSLSKVVVKVTKETEEDLLRSVELVKS